MNSNESLVGIRLVGKPLEGIQYLEQSKLPAITNYRTTSDFGVICDAIRNLDIRGAPAIAHAGAAAIALEFRRVAVPMQAGPQQHGTLFKQLATEMLATRPTAVNLSNAIEQLRTTFSAHNSREESAARIAELLLEDVQRMYAKDVRTCEAIAYHGARVLFDTVLTHCNTGALATAGMGTAIGCIVHGFKTKRVEKVIATTSGPLLQGARLTVPELMSHGIPTTLIYDSAVAHVMKQGLVSCVIVGADRIGRHGHVANKIGTLQIALLAKQFKIRFFVAAPLTTFDPAWTDADAITIEERNPDEVRRLNGKLCTRADAKVMNPAFDVTPRELVDGYVTERGVYMSPEPLFQETTVA